MTMRDRSTEGQSFGGQMESSKDTVELAQEKVGQVAGQLQDKASQLMGQAQEQAVSKIATQKDKAASTLGSVASALRQTGETLRGQSQEPFANFADKAAAQVESLSSFLQEKNPEELFGEVERFARRQPALFLGGAFVLGLLGARFLKSSNEQSQISGQGQYRQGGYGGYGGNTSYGQGQYGGQYGEQRGSQYGGQQSGGASSYQQGGNFTAESSGDTMSGGRERQAGGDLLFGSKSEEK